MTYVISAKSDGAVVGIIKTERLLTTQEAVRIMFEQYGVDPAPEAWGLFEVRKEGDR